MGKEETIEIANSTAGRDIAGGDIHHTNVYHTPRSALRELADKLRLEAERDKDLSSFIEQLQHYVSLAPEVPTRDLERKLQDAGRSDLVLEALALKERFAKKLIRLQFSERAQEMFAHLLSKIHTFFTLRVRPMVKEGVPRSRIDESIYNELLSPIYDDVGNCELGIDLADLQGMIYFLGGNCHIRWD